MRLLKRAAWNEGIVKKAVKEEFLKFISELRPELTDEMVGPARGKILLADSGT